jgi:hypothetical protein
MKTDVTVLTKEYPPLVLILKHMNPLYSLSFYNITFHVCFALRKVPSHFYNKTARLPPPFTLHTGRPVPTTSSPPQFDNPKSIWRPTQVITVSSMPPPDVCRIQFDLYSPNSYGKYLRSLTALLNGP